MVAADGKRTCAFGGTTRSLRAHVSQSMWATAYALRNPQDDRTLCEENFRANAIIIQKARQSAHDTPYYCHASSSRGSSHQHYPSMLAPCLAQHNQHVCRVDLEMKTKALAMSEVTTTKPAKTAAQGCRTNVVPTNSISSAIDTIDLLISGPTQWCGGQVLSHCPAALAQIVVDTACIRK